MTFMRTRSLRFEQLAMCGSAGLSRLALCIRLVFGPGLRALARGIPTLLCLLGLATASSPAAAVDGCKVLLCLAGNWTSVPLCVPSVEEAFEEVATGHPWPTCDSAGTSTSANQWPSEANCPPWYSIYNADTGLWASCIYSGVVSVHVSGQPWVDVYWSLNKRIASSTHYYDAAKQALGTDINPKYDEDEAAYVPPAPPPSGDGP